MNVRDIQSFIILKSKDGTERRRRALSLSKESPEPVEGES